ncbi:MAG: tetratricopeptide repeat protein [Thermoanaerobaculia bacterium]|nr:tetratricopeptide repeat protein [Thermoanaerobaculia bacterium]
MKMLILAVLAAAVVGIAGAQDFPSEPYDFVLAKLAADEGRFDEALSRIDRVIDKSPADPVLLYERAMILLDAGRIERAESELRKLVQANPEFYDAQRIFGRVLLDRAGSDRARMEEALKHLQAAFKSNPDDLSTGVTVSQLLVAAGRTDEAERVLATLVERAPDQRVINFNYAQVLTKLGRGSESRVYLERAVLLDPTFSPAILQLVDIYQKENEWRKAAEVLQPLIDQDPVNVELQRNQAYFYLRAGLPENARKAFRTLVDADPSDARSLFYLAESLNDLQQFEEADKIYRKLLEKSPSDPDLLASFGLTQIGQRKLDDAEKTFRTLLKVEAVPDNLAVLARTQLAFIELQRENYDAAVEAAKPVFVFRDKPNAQAINIALEALRKQKKYSEGVALLEPLTTAFTADPFVNARYVEMLHRSGEKEKARIAAATQAKFGTRSVVATAEAFIQAGDNDAGIDLIKNALASKPDEIELKFELGSALERAGRHDASEKAFLEILEKHPEHAGTLNYLGYMWADRNVNLDRAADMLQRAVAQEPRNGAYVDSLGWVYYRQGKLDLAEKFLTDAARLLPRDATVHEHLADVLLKRGQRQRALELYRTALSFDPSADDGAKLRSKISDVERQSQR